MRKFFILVLFALSLMGFNQVMATSSLDNNVIFNDETKSDETKTDETKTDETKDEETNPEDECE